MQENLSTILDFNINSETSVNEMVLTHRQQPLFLTMPRHQYVPDQSTSGLVAIGRSMEYRNRWQCEFEYAGDDTGSLASASSCSWTGPFEQLCVHFSSVHHPFEPAEEPYSSLCDHCATICPGWVDKPTCRPESRCPPGSWRKWFWGTMTPQAASNTTRRMLTVSDASGSPYSGLLGRSWNPTTPGSNNAEHSQLPYNPPSGGSSYYTHLVNGASAVADDNRPSHPVTRKPRNDGCRKWQPLHQISLNAGEGNRGWRPQSSSSLSKISTELESAFSRLRLDLLSAFGLYWRLVFSSLATLIASSLGAKYLFLDFSNVFLSLVIRVYMLVWFYPLAMLGLLTAWALSNGSSTKSNRVVSRSRIRMDIANLLMTRNIEGNFQKMTYLVRPPSPINSTDLTRSRKIMICFICLEIKGFHVVLFYVQLYKGNTCNNRSRHRPMQSTV